MKFERNLPFKIRVSRLAKRDAKEYAAHIKERELSSVAANKWLADLDALIKSLSYEPQMYPTIPEAEELGFAYRAIHFHSHRIVFAVETGSQTVVIFRIYHGSRTPLHPRDLEP